MRIRFDFEKAKLNGLIGILLLSSLVVVCVFLCFALLNNPHKKLHHDIFATADDVRLYYRDRPGYWHLSSDSAKKDGLFKRLLNYNDFDMQIGQGINGDLSLPSDMSFDITAKNLNKSACINLLEATIPAEQQLALLKIVLTNGDNAIEFSWGGNNTLPIEKYSARDFCLPQNNIITWTFQ